MSTYKLAALQQSTAKPLAVLGLPDELVKHLNGLGINDCERLLGTLLAAAEPWTKELEAFGVPYDALVSELRAQLPEAMLSACNDGKRSYKTGLIPD